MALFRPPSPGKNISSDRRRQLQQFQGQASLKFRQVELLNQALSHRSWANEQEPQVSNNERLEFLGDSVLGLVVAEHLHELLPDRPEGDLARIKSFVVSEESLAAIALNIGVDRVVLVGKGEEQSGGREKKAILADALEAIIGAWFLDSGFRAARRFVRQHLEPEIQKVLQNRHRKDYKTLLQELVQKQFKTYPRYRVEHKSGPDHDKTFWVAVDVNGESYGPGEGKNKKEAEQAAARKAYRALSGS